MQLGFVIDHSRCIGCHACTVACKSENDVPLGSFRTWVKYTESGTFPELRRSFAVLRCNQCTNAPCIEICPVGALHKRDDGIVDIDPQRCIGCKGCMQACPYDALYIHPERGVAQKCHFCAHRTEQGLAPACAVVCPTEAIVPGDFHDPESRVSRLRAEHALAVRKPEAGTRPNVWYRDAAPAGLDPLRTNAAGGFLWANQTPGPQLDAQLFQALESRAEARTVYDVEHPPLWGGKVAAYLFTKSLAAGAFLAGALLLPPFGLGGGLGRTGTAVTAGLGLLFLALTTLLLVFDLKRPERFAYILRYPNWSSWIAKGAFVLTGYGAAATAWLAIGLTGIVPERGPAALLGLATLVLAGLAAAYTAWLFRQARGRVLWMHRGLELSLLAHGFAAGAAMLLLSSPAMGLGAEAREVLRWTLFVALGAQGALGLLAPLFAPRGREREYAAALRLLQRGPLAGRHRAALLVGVAAPMALLLAPGGIWTAGAAALLSLAGLWIEHDAFVRAGQAPAIS